MTFPDLSGFWTVRPWGLSCSMELHLVKSLVMKAQALRCKLHSCLEGGKFCILLASKKFACITLLWLYSAVPQHLQKPCSEALHAQRRWWGVTSFAAIVASVRGGIEASASQSKPLTSRSYWLCTKDRQQSQTYFEELWAFPVLKQPLILVQETSNGYSSLNPLQFHQTSFYSKMGDTLTCLAQCI